MCWTTCAHHWKNLIQSFHQKQNAFCANLSLFIANFRQVHRRETIFAPPSFEPRARRISRKFVCATDHKECNLEPAGKSILHTAENSIAHSARGARCNLYQSGTHSLSRWLISGPRWEGGHIACAAGITKTNALVGSAWRAPLVMRRWRRRKKMCFCCTRGGLHTLQQQKCLFDYGWKLPAASRIDAPFMPNKTALWLTTAPAAARLFCCDVFWPLLAKIHKQPP